MRLKLRLGASLYDGQLNLARRGYAEMPVADSPITSCDCCPWWRRASSRRSRPGDTARERLICRAAAGGRCLALMRVLGTTARLRSSEGYVRTAFSPATDRNVMFGMRGATQTGHLIPNGSPISFSVLLVGISRDVRTTSVTCGDTRTLKFTLIVQRMPNSARLVRSWSCGHSHSYVCPASTGGLSRTATQRRRTVRAHGTLILCADRS